MAAADDSLGGKRKRQRAQVSCDRCRAIKRKCDRSDPCGRCTLDGEQCTFQRARDTAARLQQTRQARLEGHGLPGSVDAHLPRVAPSSTDSHGSFQLTGSASTSTSPASSLPTTNSTSVFDSPASHAVDASSSLRASVKQAVRNLIAYAPFLKRIVEVFVRELESYIGPVEGSRLHLFVSRHSNPVEDWPEMWQIVECHATAVAFMVAQTIPADLEAILLSMDAPRRMGFLSSERVGEAAYHLCLDLLSSLVHGSNSLSTSDAPTWTPEFFAASYMARKYEKGQGRMNRMIEEGLVDIHRLQLAGFHQRPFSHDSMLAGSGVVQDVDWQVAYRHLAFEVFWLYIGLDRILAMFSGLGYTVQPQHISVCFVDPIGHHTIHQISSNQLAQDCPCSYGDEGMPCLSAYDGIQTRVSLLMGRYTDRLCNVRLPSFQWPQDAEQIAQQLDADLFMLQESMVSLCSRQPPSMSSAQFCVLTMQMLDVRTHLAQQLCTIFIDRMFNRSTRGSSHTAELLLQRRTLDTAKAVIGYAVQMPHELSIRLNNWIFLSLFVYRQVVPLLDAVPFWLSRVHQASRAQREFTHATLLDCLQYALMGRNLLVFLTRRNELQHTKDMARSSCNQLQSLFQSFPSPQEHPEWRCIADADAICDEGALLKIIREYLHTLQFSAVEEVKSTTLEPTAADNHAAFEVDTDLDALFADLPALEQLFSSGFLQNISGSIPTC